MCRPRSKAEGGEWAIVTLIVSQWKNETLRHPTDAPAVQQAFFGGRWGARSLWNLSSSARD